MTLTSDAKILLADHGLDRDDLLIAAKTLAQTIIEESHSTETPLGGVVYEVWGLYNDGMPACRFEVTGDEDIMFEGTFRTVGGTSFAERRQTLTIEEVKTLVEQTARGALK